jgi:hypothetical protein
VEQKTPPEIQWLWWLLTGLLGIITAVIGWAAKHMGSYAMSLIKRGKKEAVAEAKEKAMIRESHTALFGTDDQNGLVKQFEQVTDATHEMRQLLEEMIRATPDLSLRMAQRRVEQDAGSGQHRALQHFPTGRVPTGRHHIYKPDPDSEPPTS